MIPIPDRCPECHTEIPKLSDVEGTWVCPCGMYTVKPTRDVIIALTEQNMRHFRQNREVVGFVMLLALGMEWWAIHKALEESPGLSSVLVSPN